MKFSKIEQMKSKNLKFVIFSHFEEKTNLNIYLILNGVILEEFILIKNKKIIIFK
jgi:hypothetical protein